MGSETPNLQTPTIVTIGHRLSADKVDYLKQLVYSAGRDPEVDNPEVETLLVLLSVKK